MNITLQPGETKIDTWTLLYLPPNGGKYNGKLTITNQRLLYDAGQTGWLGVARIGMGWPLTALAALLTYVAIKAAQRALAEAGSAEVLAGSTELEVDTSRD